MPCRARFLAAAILAVVPWAAASSAQDHGRIAGRVSHEDGTALAGVAVVLAAAERPPTTTDARGRFAFENVAPGACTLIFSLGTQSDTATLQVAGGATAEVHKVVDWEPHFADTMTVYAASRRVERIVDAPAAVSAITPVEIERGASLGQVPKLFESAPAAELTQSSLYDFKLNVRGINGTVQRRVAVAIDGRNPSVPYLGAQEWAAVSFPPDDVASAELVRGPSSALYGTNAFNGFLDLTTKAPRDSLGGTLRLAAGNLATGRLDFRAATELGGGWYFKGVGGYHESDDFTISRNETLEYSQPCTATRTTDCLLLEVEPLAQDRVVLAYASARFDKHLGKGRTFVIEGGTADIEGISTTTSAGRFLFQDVRRPWVRVNLNTPRWNVLGYYTGRDASDIQSLAAGGLVYLDTARAALEAQTHWDFADGRGRLVGGAFLSREEYDSANPEGVQTLKPETSPDADLAAVFAQLDYEVGERLKLVVAGRWDDNSLHAARVSPKGALVYSISPYQTLRFGYNGAFQAPNYAEFYVRVGLAPPVDLSAFEELFCVPSGVSCGFDQPLPIVAAGNKNLTVEKIESAEVGYSAILGDKALLTVDYYRTKIRDFVKILIPQLGTELGRADPSFGPYVPPADLPADQAAALMAALEGLPGGLFPFLTNSFTGDPLFVLLAIVNFGRVETQGLELSLDYALGRSWSLDLNYSWLDFDVQEELAEAPLESNGPKNKLNFGLTYRGARISAALHYRWFDSFRWAEGTLNGPVPSFDVVNLAGTYRLSDSWEVGLNVSNLFDNRHYEVFSGDLIGRRVLAHVAFSW